MKLASIKNNTRDGQLIVVNKELTFAIAVPDIALTLQGQFQSESRHKRKKNLMKCSIEYKKKQ